MSGITRVGLDSAGGVIFGGGQDFVSVEGAPVALKGDPVAGHGLDEHAGPVLAEGVGFFTINGVEVVRAGNAASCGHEATGSDFFTITE